MKKKLIFIFSLVLLFNASHSFAMQERSSNFSTPIISGEIANDELIQAINRGNVEEIQPPLSAVVQEVITNKKNPNQIKICGEPLLLRVVQYYCGPGDLQKLLEYPKTDPNQQSKNGMTPLHMAVAIKSKDAVKLLLDHPKIDPNQSGKHYHFTPLYLAVAIKSKTVAIDVVTKIKDVVKLLLDHPKTDPNQPDKDSESPLHFAVKNGAIDIIRMFLDHFKIDPNQPDKDGRTSLHWAILKNHNWWWGKENLVKLLLSHPKIDPNQPDKNWRQTPLHLSVEYGEVGITRILLDHPKIDLSIPDNTYGETPLKFAKRMKHTDIIKLFAQPSLIQAINEDDCEKIAQAMKNGAKINYQQLSNGDTPIHVAVKSGNPEVVAYLLQFKPNLTIENNGGETAIRLAVGHDGNKILKNVFLNPAFERNSTFNRLFSWLYFWK